MTKLEAIKILLDVDENEEVIAALLQKINELERKVNILFLAIILCQKNISETTGFTIEEIREKILNDDREFLAIIGPQLGYVTFKEIKGLKPRRRPKKRKAIKSTEK